MNEQDINAALQHYSLGPLRALVPFDFPDRPWKISVDGGDFVIRECFLNRHAADIGFEHRLASWLDAHGYPVSQPMVTQDDRTWCEVADRVFAVYSLIPGRHFGSGNDRQARAAGGALAWFHDVARALPGARNKGLPLGYRFPSENAAFLMQEHGDRGEIKLLVTDFERLGSRLPSTLPEALLFNDFHPENLLFSGNEFSGAFDLDRCYWGPRLLDVALSLLSFTLSLEGTEGGPGDVVFHLDCGRAWLAGYSERGHLDSAEIYLLPLALRLQARSNALFDLTDVARQSKRWVQHEWDYIKLQMDLVDTNSHRIVESST